MKQAKLEIKSYDKILSEKLQAINKDFKGEKITLNNNGIAEIWANLDWLKQEVNILKALYDKAKNYQ